MGVNGIGIDFHAEILGGWPRGDHFLGSFGSASITTAPNNEGNSRDHKGQTNYYN